MGWILGTKVIFPVRGDENFPHIEGGLEVLQKELDSMGAVKVDEIKSAVFFLLVLGFWATDKLHGVSATAAALIGATLALMPAIKGLRIPKIGVITWNDADIPWHLFMFSFGAYVLGGGLKATKLANVGVDQIFSAIGITDTTPKLVIFLLISGLFLFSSIVMQSKTARTLIFFPIIIGVAQKFNYDVLGFALPMAFLINQVYVLYFNSKPATICYLSNHYTTGESFKYGVTMLFAVWGLLVLWAQYYMPLLGFDSKLW